MKEIVLSFGRRAGLIEGLVEEINGSWFYNPSPMSIVHCRFYLLHWGGRGMNELNMETSKWDHTFDRNSKFIGSDVFIDMEQRIILCWTEITIKYHVTNQSTNAGQKSNWLKLKKMVLIAEISIHQLNSEVENVLSWICVQISKLCPLGDSRHCPISWTALIQFVL